MLVFCDPSKRPVQFIFEALHQGIMRHWRHNLATEDSSEAWQVPGLDREPEYSLALEELRIAQAVQGYLLQPPYCDVIERPLPLQAGETVLHGLPLRVE